MGETNRHKMTENEKKNNIKRTIGNITNNLGKIEIRGNQIICYVDNKKLQKYLNDNNNMLTLKGFTELDKLRLEALYGIGKQIKYVIDDYNFTDVFLDTIGDTILHFNNCTFKGYELNVGYIKNIVFNNSKFFLDNGLNLFNNNTKQIESVKIIDCSCSFDDIVPIPSTSKIFIVSDRIYISGGNLFCSENIVIKANKINLSETKLEIWNPFSCDIISIFSDDFIMNKSSIYGYNLTLDCNSMKAKDNTIYGRKTKIVNEKCDIGELNCKCRIKYNDVTLLPNRKYYITPESYELLKERERLVNVLYQVNEKCEEEVSKKIKVLRNQSIYDTLGK